MPTSSANEAARTFTRNTTLETAKLLHLGRHLTGTDRHGSKESIPRFRIRCSTYDLSHWERDGHNIGHELGTEPRLENKWLFDHTLTDVASLYLVERRVLAVT